MIKIKRFLTILLCGSCFITGVHANENTANNKEEATTKADAVIFKVHDVTPIAENGVVISCDYTVTLYNRTPVNFRTFTINLEWADDVESNFSFDKYVETVIGKEEALKQKEFLDKRENFGPLTSSITVNAFGMDQQVSMKAHLNSEKCYLLLSKADYKVTPCDIVRSTDSTLGTTNDCTAMFQLVDTGNPEYFGKFKNISATDLALQRKESEKRELSDIDIVINKIVENLGTSGSALADIN